MKRRAFLTGLSGLSLTGFACRGYANSAAGPGGGKGGAAVEELQKNWKTLLRRGADVAERTEPLKLSKEEWKKRLARRPTACCARRAPSAPAPARSTTRSARACSSAPAAACRCSPRR